MPLVDLGPVKKKELIDLGPAPTPITEALKETEPDFLRMPPADFEPNVPSKLAISPGIEQKEKPIGVIESFKREGAIGALKRAPFSPYRGAEEAGYLQAQKRLKEGKYPYEPRYEMTPMGGYTMVRPRRSLEQDKAFVSQYEKRKEEEQRRGFTIPAHIAQGVAELPSWMAEIYATGGIATGFKKALPRIATRAAVATGLMPHRFNETYGKSRIDRPKEKPSVSMAKAYGSVYIENFSELTGEFLVKGAKRLLAPVWKKLPFGKKFITSLGKVAEELKVVKSTKDFLNRISTRAGYSGLLAEIGEERIATIMHSIAGTEDFGAGPDAKWDERLKAGILQDLQPRNIIIETAVLSVPGMARYVAGKAMAKPLAPKITPEPQQPSGEKRKAIREKGIEEYRAKVTEQKAQQLAKELEKSLNLSPEAALRVARKKLEIDAGKATEAKAIETAKTAAERVEKPPVPAVQPSKTEIAVTRFVDEISLKVPGLIVKEGDATGLTYTQVQSGPAKGMIQPTLHINKKQLKSRLNEVQERVRQENPNATDVEIQEAQNEWIDNAIKEELIHIEQQKDGTTSNIESKWEALPKKTKQRIRLLYDRTLFGDKGRIVSNEELYLEYDRIKRQIQSTGTFTEAILFGDEDAFVSGLRKAITEETAKTAAERGVEEPQPPTETRKPPEAPKIAQKPEISPVEGEVDYEKIAIDLGGRSHALPFLPKVIRTYAEQGIERGQFELEQLVDRMSESEGDLTTGKVFKTPESPEAERYFNEMDAAIQEELGITPAEPAVEGEVVVTEVTQEMKKLPKEERIELLESFRDEIVASLPEKGPGFALLAGGRINSMLIKAGKELGLSNEEVTKFLISVTPSGQPPSKPAPKIEPAVEPEAKTKAKVGKKKISAKDEFKVGDVVNTKGQSNMADPVTINAIQGNTLKFTDAKGVEYAGMARATVRRLIEGSSWERVSGEALKAPAVEPEAKPPAKEKEFEIEPGKFYTQAKIDEAITKGEMGEIEIEPVSETESSSFNKHIDYFQTRQLPETSQIRKIQKQMQVLNGKRLAGTITAKEANTKIRQLRKVLFETAEKEGIALRMTKGGKVSVAVRKAGTYVPVEFAKYKKFQDIYPRAQDVTRSIQQIDGALSVKEKKKMPGQAGMAEQHILWPTREIHMQKDRYIKEKAVQLKKILTVKKGSKKDTQINLVLEKIAKADRDKPIKDVLSAKTIKAMGVTPDVVNQAVALRKWYDESHDEQNIARRMRDQKEIPYHRNYSPQILRDATIWEQITMTGKTAEDVFGKKAPIPDYIRPNKPFNPREMARKAGIRYEDRIKSATELAGRYLSTAAKDIFNTSIIQNNKAFIQQLEAMGYEKPARYLADWTSQAYAGIMPSIDRALMLGETPKARKGMMKWNQVRNLAVFPLNVGWTLGTQIKSFAMTIGRYGSVNITRGFYQWLKPSVRRQAAEDYYSFIVKSAKQGKVTRQDAKNLIGEEVKIRRTKGEIARDLTTLFLEEMEKLLTGTSIRAAHLHGKKRGLTGEALKNYASDGGAKTQSMYNDEDKPLFLTNLTVKTVTPYQTYCYETMNTLREWAGRTGTPPDSKMYAIWSLVRYLAAMAVMNQIEASIRGRKWSWLRLVPMPFSELWLSPIYKHFTKEWLPGGSGLLSPVETASRLAKGIDDVLETGSWRKLRNELIKYGPGLFLVPAGVQWARLVDGIITYSQGGVYDRRGKLLFKMKDPQDLARAIFTGVWSTKGGQEYLEKRTGKKQEGKRKTRLEREKKMLRK